MALPNYLGPRWSGPAPKDSSDPNWNLWASQNAARELADKYRVLKATVAREWNLPNPEASFESQGLQGIALQKARQQLRDGTKALLAEAQKVRTSTSAGPLARRESLKQDVANIVAGRIKTNDVATAMRDAMLEVLELQSFAALTPPEKTTAIRSMVEQKDWTSLHSILSAPARMIGLDPRVREAATTQMHEGVAPVSAAELALLDNRALAVEETWGIVERSVMSDSGLDVAERDQAIADRRASATASDLAIRNGGASES